MAPDCAGRYVLSLGENAGQAALIAAWRATKRLQVFSLGTMAVGGKETEFTSLAGKSFLPVWRWFSDSGPRPGLSCRSKAH
jgi:hypothetical protein